MEYHLNSSTKGMLGTRKTLLLVEIDITPFEGALPGYF